MLSKKLLTVERNISVAALRGQPPLLLVRSIVTAKSSAFAIQRAAR